LNNTIGNAATPVDVDRLRQGVALANIPTLLMLLVQLTGDTKWLLPPYAPKRARGLDDNDSGGLPDNVQQEIRAAAGDAIVEFTEGKLAPDRPDNALLTRMLSVAMAEEVPLEYGDVIATTLGLESERSLREAPPGTTAIVVGGGISGICAAIKLRQMGIICKIFEKNPDFGGTWWENNYPGCGVDTPNLTYTFSFAATDWTRYFPLQREILGYLLKTADQHALRGSVSFESTVKRATWRQDVSRWDVLVQDKTGRQCTYCADVLISAVGVLNVPQIPNIPGAESFKGPIVHTARWPRDLDIANKRVAVVGNGASAMQLVPAIAPKVKSLTIFARSKQWAAPFPQFGKSVPDAVRYLIETVPLYRLWYEQRLSWTFNDRVHGSLFKDPEWMDPGRSVNSINDRHRESFTRYIKSELGDRQDLLEHVLPDYPPFAKRMLLDNGWYRTLRRENTRLIAHHLAEIRGDTLIASNGEKCDADIVILATGFRPEELLGSFDVVGRDGLVLGDFWDHDNASAYLGTTVPGFPNFFVMFGPNVGSGHGGSMIRSIENQANYMARILEAMFEQNARVSEVRAEVYDEYRTRVDAAHEKLVWTHKGVDNWYRNSRGRVIAITPWRNDAFWRMTREANRDDYHFHSPGPDTPTSDSPDTDSTMVYSP
jgi:4-hydroxyacetophenone monooxygenase